MQHITSTNKPLSSANMNAILTDIATTNNMYETMLSQQQDTTSNTMRTEYEQEKQQNLRTCEEKINQMKCEKKLVHKLIK